MDPLRRADSVDTVIKPAPLSDHDAYDLFGTGTTHVGASVGEPLKPHKEIDPAPLPAAHVPLEVESPTAFTLFPSAAPVPPEVVKPSNGSNGAETVEDDFVLFPSASAIPPYSSSKSLPADSSSVPSYSFSKSMPPESSTVSDEAIAQVLYAESEALPPPASYASDEAYAQALDLRLNGMSLAPPPPQFKNSGNAVDIIAARSTGNQIFSTSWHVMFSWSRFRSNISTGVGDTVRVLVNGKELPTKMILQERGRCIFTTGGLTPPTTDLLQVELFEDRPNLVRFEHFQKSSDSIRYVESRLHLWGPNESVIVADLDGTLTISDVEGHIRTLRLGQYDFLHSGACEFFTKLHELDMRIVYLTARPIDWASASRTHLENAKQQTHTLPPGPLITNSNGLTGALLTEVVNKNPHVFKAQVLNEIQLTLIHAGRVIEHPVFVAGFGNRPTDTVAYEQVGIDPNLIFLIDPYSNLKASTNPRIYESYCDPNALLWLLPKLKHKVPIEKVQRIDDYTVRELVLAEDREQLLMAEREARRLQEEEYDRAARRSSGNMPAMNPATSLRGSKYSGSFGI